MGVMPVGLQYRHLLFHYYGHKDAAGIWIRDLVLVQPPGTPIYIPQMKIETNKIFQISWSAKSPGRTWHIDIQEQAGNFFHRLGIDRNKIIAQIGHQNK